MGLNKCNEIGRKIQGEEINNKKNKETQTRNNLYIPDLLCIYKRALQYFSQKAFTLSA